MDRAAKEVGINFIGGFSALVQKGCAHGDKILLKSIPEALATTDVVCSSVNIGSSRNGLNMDAVKDMGEIIRKRQNSLKIKIVSDVRNLLFL